MDKLLNALRETLAQLGLDEQAIEAALQEAVAKAEQTEEKPAEGDPVQEPPVEEVPPTEPEIPGEEVSSEVPSADLPTEEVPPVEGEPEVLPTEPVPPAEPPVPAFDPAPLIAKVDELQGKLDEQIKANEGLVARIQSLEEGLKAAGVIDGSTPTVTEVGDPMPSAAPQNPTDDVFSSVLDELNRK